MKYESYSGLEFYRESDLRHHGILGQRWGKRNGPPYPLGYNAHSSAEKRLNPKKRISSGDDSSASRNPSSESKIFRRATSEKRGGTNSTHNDKIKKNNSESEKRTKQDSIIGLSHDDFNAALLKKNPNAAVVDPSILEWAKAHKKELAIGAGIAVGVAISAGALYYMKKQGVRIPANKVVQSPVIRANPISQAVKAGEERIKALQANASGIFSNTYKVDRGAVANESGGLDPQRRFIKQWLVADIHRFDAISQSAYDSMDNAPVHINAGGNMYRMSKSAHKTLRNGIEYVSINEEDRKRYIGFLPQMWSAKGGAKSAYYEAVLAANTNIKAPGKKETIDIMRDTVKKFYRYDDDKAKAYVFKNFYQLQANLVNRNDVFGEQFFKELSARGYNACVDFNDAGRLADKPLILLNASKDASIKNLNKWSKQEAYKLFENIRLPEAANSFTDDDFAREVAKHPLGSMYQLYVDVYANRH